VGESPIERLLQAIDKLDVDAVMALAAPDIKLLVVDGRHAEGAVAVRELLAAFMSELRSSAHRVTDQWHVDDVWIAEVLASYELTDRTRPGELSRAFIIREGSGGFSDLRVYGAHERPLEEHQSPGHELRLGGRWIPPL